MWSTEILLLIGLAPVDHLALALADRRHVGRDGAGYHAEVRALARQMRDPRAPNLVLLGRQAMLGQEPPTHRRSTTAVRRPDCAMCQASNLPPFPLPRISTSNCSGRDMSFLR